MNKDTFAPVERMLPVPLTRQEVIDRAKMLTELMEKDADAVRAAKNLAAAEKEAQKARAGEIERVRVMVKTGKENRLVECRWMFNFTANTKTLVRTDSGEELEVTAMSESERQIALDFKDDMAALAGLDPKELRQAPAPRPDA